MKKNILLLETCCGFLILFNILNMPPFNEMETLNRLSKNYINKSSRFG